MGSLQQASHADIWLCAKGAEVEEGDCAIEARAGEHVAARQLFKMGEAGPAAQQGRGRIPEAGYVSPLLCIITPANTVLDGSLRSHQTAFTSAVSTLRWVGTQGLRFVLQFWFAKSPMFWMPAGWVPYYVEWILSFPRAPLGSVSINVWGIACASMVALAAEGLAAGWVLVTHRPTPAAAQKQRGKEEAMAFEANPKPARSIWPGEKKEL
jgi:hypothetical protein